MLTSDIKTLFSQSNLNYLGMYLYCFTIVCIINKFKKSQKEVISLIINQTCSRPVLTLTAIWQNLCVSVGGKCFSFNFSMTSGGNNLLFNFSIKGHFIMQRFHDVITTLTYLYLVLVSFHTDIDTVLILRCLYYSMQQYTV